MAFAVTTHLNFRGRARAALNFYEQVFGGAKTLVTYGDAGQADLADAADAIMWGQVATNNGFRIMAFDVQAGRAYDAGTNAFFVSLRATSAEDIQARWSALADGATVLVPLGPSSWSALYGMLTDRFGVTWILDVEPGTG